ncbi:MAG: PEGA domain-containing protein, partial [Bdellovibrionota bacterium]
AFLGPNFGVRVPVLSDLLVDLTSGGSPKLVLDGNQKDVIVTVNGQTVAHSLPATITAITPGSPFQLVVSGQDGTFQQSFTLSKGEKRTVPVILTQPERTIASPNQPIFGGTDSGMGAAMGGKTIQLRLNITPGGGAPLISIKGKPVDPNNPSVNVPLDSPLELVVERQGFKPFKREFVLESRQMSGLKEWLMDVPLDPLHFGFLTIHTTPSADATIQLDGKPWVKKTPLENEKLPTGTYDIRLNNEVLGMEKRISVTIQEGKSISLDERLEIRN